MTIKYNVTFRTHFNESGECDDCPTEWLYVSGIIKAMEFVERRPPVDGGEFGKEEWQYEVEESNNNAFLEAIDRCRPVIWVEKGRK